MKNLYLTLLAIIVTISSFGQVQSVGYDDVDFYFDSLYTVNYAAYKAEKDSIALVNAYKGLNILAQDAGDVKELYIKNNTIDTLPYLAAFVNVESVVLDGCVNIDLENTFDKLATLPHLKSLEIIRCKQYSIPENIAGLTSLENLNLIGNKFVRLPEEMINIKSLNSINVSNNALLNEDLFFPLINKKTTAWQSVIADNCQIRELPQGNYTINSLSLDKNLLTTISTDVEVEVLSLSSNPYLDLDDLFDNLSNSEIQYLDLSYCSIDDLSSNIKKLTSLNHLYLQGNNLTSIPSEIGDLTNLVTLDIGNESEYRRTNHIQSLPSSIGNLKELNYLNFSGNKIAKLPASFGGLSSLVHCDFSWNKLDYFPSEITALTNLEYLNLGYNPVKTIPENIGDLVNLNYLNLSGDFFFHYTTKISVVPTSIAELSNLDTLILKDNVIEELPDNFGDLDLIYFDIADNLLSYLPTDFGMMSRMTYLDIAANEMKNLPADFNNLSALTYLDMSLNYDMDTDVESYKIANLKNLKELNIADCNFTITAVELLQKELATTTITTALDRE